MVQSINQSIINQCCWCGVSSHPNVRNFQWMKRLWKFVLITPIVSKG